VRHTTVIASYGVCVTALDVVRWKPISPFQSARGSVCGDGYRTFHVETACATYVSLVD